MKKTPSTPSTSVETAKTKRKKRTLKNILWACALSLALILPWKASAQEQISPETNIDSIESVTSIPTQVLDEFWEKEKSNLEVHGSVRAWSNVTPLLWSVLSDTPAFRFTIDISDPKTGLWASVIRFDDFNKSMDNPASQLTMVDLYWHKKFWKVSFTWVWEYANIDKIPWSDSFTPIIWATYDAWKWWTFDTWACYTIQKGEDVAAFRAWVVKKINDAFSLAAQVIHNNGLSWHFQAKLKITNKLSMEIGWIADKNWKITPTAWVLFGI